MTRKSTRYLILDYLTFLMLTAHEGTNLNIRGRTVDDQAQKFGHRFVFLVEATDLSFDITEKNGCSAKN